MAEICDEELTSVVKTQPYGSKEEWQPLKLSTSFKSLDSFNEDVCRICHCEGDNECPLISPCACSGSLKYVHQDCLQQWIKSANMKSCELCKVQFTMTATIKPFCKWQKLEMTKVESRKIMCSVTFHLIAITCVVWSLYVLIERTMEEVKGGKMEWPFWTKLIVVGIGFTGGFVFMYIQCKMYLQLCSRWRAYNRVIYVQNCPNNKPSPPDSNHSSRHVVVEFDENDKVLRPPIKAEENVQCNKTDEEGEESSLKQSSINEEGDCKKICSDRYVNPNDHWKYKEVSETLNDVISTNSHKYTALSNIEPLNQANNHNNKVGQTYKLDNFDFSLISNKGDDEHNMCVQNEDSFDGNTFCLVHPIAPGTTDEVNSNGADRPANKETYSPEKPRDNDIDSSKDVNINPNISHFEVISHRIDDTKHLTHSSPV